MSLMPLCSRVAGLLVSRVPGRGAEAVEFLTEGAIVSGRLELRFNFRILVVFAIRHEQRLVHYAWEVG